MKEPLDVEPVRERLTDSFVGEPRRPCRDLVPADERVDERPRHLHELCTLADETADARHLVRKHLRVGDLSSEKGGCVRADVEHHSVKERRALVVAVIANEGDIDGGSPLQETGKARPKQAARC